MLAFLKIAWRDLWRHKLRSGLTMCVIMFGAGITLFYYAFTTGAFLGELEYLLKIFPGYLQVHRAGYQMDQTIARAMPLDPRLTAALDRMPGVTAYSPRLCTGTFVQSGGYLANATICGVLPDHEVKTSRVAQTFFPDMIKLPRGTKTNRGYSGKYLSASEPKSVVIGEVLARNLQVKVGDELSLTTQDAYGSMAAINFKISGIFHSCSDKYDSSMMLVNLGALQDFLGMSGQVTQIAIIVKDLNDIPAVEKALYGAIAEGRGPWTVDSLGRGLWMVRPNKPTLPEDSPLQLANQEILDKMLSRIPGLKDFSMEVRTDLALNGATVATLGVDPAREMTVNDAWPKAASGLTGADWVLLDSSIAEKSRLKTGDLVMLTGANYAGEPVKLELKLAGVVAPGGKARAYVPLAVLQDRLWLGENVSQVTIKLPGSSESEARSLIGSRLNYEVVLWRELRSNYMNTTKTSSYSMSFIGAILFVIIGFVFMLTILMSVLERVRQFGIMKAIGTRPSEIFVIILLESAMLGLLGTALGLMLGLIPSLYLIYNPINFYAISEEAGRMMEAQDMPSFIYAKLTARMLLKATLINFCLVLVTTIPPALRASRTKLAQTLRLQ